MAEQSNQKSTQQPNGDCPAGGYTPASFEKRAAAWMGIAYVLMILFVINFAIYTGGRELRRLDGGKVAQALGTNADRLDTPFSDGEGDIFVYSDTQAAVLDGDGNVRFTLDGGHGALLAGLALLGDGTVGAYVYDGSNDETPYTLRRVDKEAEGLGETYCSLSQPYGFLPGGEDILTYYLSGDGLYRCRKDAPAGELVLNWMDSGLNALDAAAVAEQEDGSLTALLVGGGAARLISLTPTDAAASEGKTTLDRKSVV